MPIIRGLETVFATEVFRSVREVARLLDDGGASHGEK
jgi:hypothetical protein